jgi:copper chaperone
MIKLKIEGMTCGHCVMSVQKALAAVPGVEGSVEVTLKPGQAVVAGAPSPDALIAAVAEEGYTATLVG